MQSFYSFCYGTDDEEGRNKPVYKDGTFWTMLGVIVAAVILTSIVANMGHNMTYRGWASSILKSELFFLPLPMWLMPIVWLGLYALYFLGVYLMYRRINANCEICSERRNKSKSYMWLLYIVFLTSNFLWAWALFGAAQPMVAMVFLGFMIAAIVCQLVLTGKTSWGGAPNGAWYFLWAMAAYLFLIALPLNVLAAFMKDSPMWHKYRSFMNGRMGAKVEVTGSLPVSVRMTETIERGAVRPRDIEMVREREMETARDINALARDLETVKSRERESLMELESARRRESENVRTMDEVSRELSTLRRRSAENARELEALPSALDMSERRGARMERERTMERAERAAERRETRGERMEGRRRMESASVLGEATTGATERLARLTENLENMVP